jgi:hypothetical protein
MRRESPTRQAAIRSRLRSLNVERCVLGVGRYCAILILSGMMLVLAGRLAPAGEALTPETLLPVHEGRDAYTPAAVWGKESFLVVWQSGRLAPGDLRNGFLGQGDIVACRVDKSGKPLDAQPIVVSGAKELQEQPQVAYGNGIFLAVWQDYRNGKDYDVYAARVTAEGKALDADGILVSGGGPSSPSEAADGLRRTGHNQALPRVCWDGKSFLVVWQDFRSDKLYEAYGARVSTDGKVLDPAGIKLGGGENGHALTPAAAWRGQGPSLVIWCGDYSNGAPASMASSLLMLVEDGKIVNPETHRHKNDRSGLGPAAGTGASLAAGADAYLVAWTTDTPSGRGNAAGANTTALYDAQGRYVKSLLIAAGEKEAARIRYPEAVWEGSGFVVAWHQLWKKGRGKDTQTFDAVFMARVSPKGELVGAPAEVAGSETSPACEACVASDGAGTTLVAYERQPEKGDVPIKIGVRILTAR